MKPEISREELDDMYNRQRMSLSEIAERLKSSTMAIRRLMEGFDLPRRTPAEAKTLILPYDDLRELYINKGLGVQAVAAHFQCCDETVERNLRRQDIPIRPRGRIPVQHVPDEVLAAWEHMLATGQVTELASNLAYALGLLASDGNLPKDREGVCMSSTEMEVIDFIRGCWDGDGGWDVRHDYRGNREHHYLRGTLNSGSPTFLAWVRTIIERLVGLSGYIYGVKLCYHGRNAVTLGRWLYCVPHPIVPPLRLDIPALSYKYIIWQRFALPS